MKSFDTIVIGVGGMGSAALWQLARRGQKVLGIERFDLGHSMGSSHGLNRIIRLAYFEHPNYVPLLRRAYELWREAEQLTKEQLLFVTGGIDAGAEDSRIVQGALTACREHDLSHEVMTARETQQRFPGYKLPEIMPSSISQMQALWHQNAPSWRTPPWLFMPEPRSTPVKR